MNVSRNGVFAIVQVVLAAAAITLVYRHTIAVLGAQQLGVWSVTFAMASLASLGDLGVTAATVREIARTRADRDWAGMREAATTCAVFGIAGMSIAALALAGPLHAAGAAILGKASLAVPIELTMVALVVAICNGLGTGATGIVEAFERYDLKTALVTAGYVVLIVLAYWLVRPLGLMGFGLALLGQAIVNLCGAAFIASRLAPGPLLGRKAFSIPALKALLRSGLPLRASAFLNIALEPLTRVLMVRFGGAEMAAVYEVVTRLVLQVRTIAVSAMQVIIPRLVLIHRSSGRSSDSSLDAYLRMASSGALLIFATLALCLPAISQFVFGSVSSSFVIFGMLLCAAWFVNVLAVPSYFANVAHGTLLGNWLAHATLASLNVVLGIGFGYIAGAHGVVIGTCTAIVIGSLVTVFDRLRRDTGSMVYTDRVMIALLASGIAIAALLIANDSGHAFASSWMAWLSGASLFALAGAVCIAFAFRGTLVQVFRP